MRRLLRAKPSLAGKRGPDGATPLHFAGTPAVARALLAAGANANVTTTRYLSVKDDYVQALLAEAAGVGSLIRRRFFYVIDHEHISAASGWFQLEA
jgi:hypothetical protein